MAGGKKKFSMNVWKEIERLDDRLDDLEKDFRALAKELRASEKKEVSDMSVLSDKIAAVKTEAAAAVDRVTADVAALKARIAELEAMVAGGVATPQDLQDLEDLKATLAGLDPTVPQTLPKKKK